MTGVDSTGPSTLYSQRTLWLLPSTQTSAPRDSPPRGDWRQADVHVARLVVHRRAEHLSGHLRLPGDVARGLQAVERFILPGDDVVDLRS